MKLGKIESSQFIDLKEQIVTSIVLGAVGAIAGGMMGNPGLGWSIGSSIGGMMEDGPNTEGPRITDLQVQGSTYGASIPIYYGTARGAGQVIWSSDLIEVANEESAGGKGDGPTYTSYTYYVNCAVAVCEGEISGISRIWANGTLIYDIRPENENATGASPNIRVYTGSETQLPDALLESYLGAGNVPAHRGLAYVVFQMFPLANYGNRLPNFTFEVINNGSSVISTNQMIMDETYMHGMPHPFYEGIYLYTTKNDDGLGTNIFLHVVDGITKNDMQIPIYVDSDYAAASGWLAYVEYGIDLITGVPLEVNELWINTDRSYARYTTPEIAVAMDIYSLSFKRRIIPPSYSGMAWPGKLAYDKSRYQVLVLNSGSTIADGARYLEPFSAQWVGGKFNTGYDDWYTGPVLKGNSGVVGAINYSMWVVFFANGVKGAQHTGSKGTMWGQAWTYDTRRGRWIGFSRNVGGLAVFRYIEDDAFRGFPVTDIYTTNANLDDAGRLTYWPIADKLVYRADVIKIINPDTLQVERQASNPSIGNVGGGYLYEIPGLPDYAIGMVNSPSWGVARIPLESRISSSDVQLKDIVSDICSRVDLAASDIDVTQLTDAVQGYIITQQMTARAALESLQSGFFFDAVESD